MPLWKRYPNLISLRLALAMFVFVLITSVFQSACGGGGSSATPPPASTITSVSVACSPTSVETGQTSQCTATVTGTGNYSSTVSWSVEGIQGGNSTLGTISSSGLYTAPGTVPNPNTVTVNATSVQDASKVANTTLTVTPPPPTITSVSVSCNPSTVQTGQTSQCAATVTGTGSYNSSVTWSASAGTINSSGLFAAPATSGSVTVTATSVQDTTKSGSAVVTVTTPPTITSVSVSCNPTSVQTGGTSQCTATVTGTGSYSSAVTWSASAGTIDSSGLFTAPAMATTVTVTATSVQDTTKSGNTTVTVTAPSGTITSVSVSCNPTSVQVGQTSQCTATVTGTGSYSSAVNWSVAGVQGGNSTVGTISTTGLYTAPSSIPSTNPVTVTATSAQDTTQSGSASVTITATSAAFGITSLDQTTVDPFAFLTITGTGSDPANAAISVLLTPGSTSPPIAIPALAATTTTLQIAVPMFFNTTTGTFTAGTVNVQGVQLDGNTLSTSNVVALQINAPPALPTGMPPGGITSMFLLGGLSLSSTIQADAVTNPSLAPLAADLTNYDSDAQALFTSIQTVVNNPTQSVPVTTVNGATFTLDANTLTLSDQLILTYATQFLSQTAGDLPDVQDLSRTLFPLQQPSQSNVCGTGDYGDPLMLTTCEQMTQEHQALPSAGWGAVKLGFSIEFGAWLGMTGGLAADGFAEAGSITATTAKAIEIAWNTAIPYVTSYTTASTPPSASNSMKGVAAEVLDEFFLGGVGILPSALDAFNIYEDASQILGSDAGQAPQGGILLTASQSNAPSGTTAVNGFQVTNGTPTTTDYAAPDTQESEPTSTATIPAPTLEMGIYSGACYGGESSFTCGTQTIPASFETILITDVQVGGEGGETLSSLELVICGTASGISDTMSCTCTVGATSVTCVSMKSEAPVSTCSSINFTATCTVTEQ